MYLYVGAITNYDPFEHDYMMYRIRNCCQEIPELIYDDGLEFLYFYTGGHRGGNDSIKAAMLNYFQNSTRENVTDRTTEEATQKAAEKEKQKLNDMTRKYILMYFQSKGAIPDGLVDELKEIDDTEQLQSCYEKALEMQEIEDYMQFLREVKKKN